MGWILIGLNAIGVRRLWPYLLAGILLWYFVHESGVHATVAGVALAFAIPTRTRINGVEFSGKARDVLDRLDRTETGDVLVLTSTADFASRTRALQLLGIRGDAALRIRQCRREDW